MTFNIWPKWNAGLTKVRKYETREVIHVSYSQVRY